MTFVVYSDNLETFVVSAEHEERLIHELAFCNRDIDDYNRDVVKDYCVQIVNRTPKIARAE